jgi:hypothetical protein
MHLPFLMKKEGQSFQASFLNETKPPNNSIYLITKKCLLIHKKTISILFLLKSTIHSYYKILGIVFVSIRVQHKKARGQSKPRSDRMYQDMLKNE